MKEIKGIHFQIYSLWSALIETVSWIAHAIIPLNNLYQELKSLVKKPETHIYKASRQKDLHLILNNHPSMQKPMSSPFIYSLGPLK